jgi:hypothetical protein
VDAAPRRVSTGAGDHPTGTLAHSVIGAMQAVPAARRGFGRCTELRSASTFAMWGKVLVLTLCLGCGGPRAQSASPDALRARFAVVRAQTARNIFDRPLYLQSSESSGLLQGEVFALVDYSYDDVRHVLAQADHWCGILILHLNVKYCRASSAAGRDVLEVGIGRKVDQPLWAVNWVVFAYHIDSAGNDYLSVVLQAPTGPLSTRNLRILMEAVSFEDRRSLLHMTYAYSYGKAARWAMQGYLATLGSAKLGFSIVGRSADGQAIRAGGPRGLLERNTMRYYLAVEAYLAARRLPASQQIQQALQDWFTATERYPLQLHEIDRSAYIDMKLREIRRQETQDPPAHGD